MYAIRSYYGGSTLDPIDKAILAGFATEWNLSSVQPTVRLDGYASYNFV